MKKIAGTVSPAAFASLMQTRCGEELRITLDDGRVLTGRSTGHLLMVVMDTGRAVQPQRYEVVRVSAFNVVKIEA